MIRWLGAKRLEEEEEEDEEKGGKQKTHSRRANATANGDARRTPDTLGSHLVRYRTIKQVSRQQTLDKTKTTDSSSRSWTLHLAALATVARIWQTKKKEVRYKLVLC